MSRRVAGAYVAARVLMLAGALAVAAYAYEPADWHPIPLLMLLMLLGAVGERMSINLGGQTVSASFISFVLAMTLLGPAPAVVVGLAGFASDSLKRRPPWLACLGNLSNYCVYPVVGGLIARLLLGNVHAPGYAKTLDGATFALAIFGVFLISNLCNFALAALHSRVVDGQGFGRQIQTILIPVLPGQLAAAGLAAGLALIYTKLGYSVLLSLVFVLLIFQYLAIALARSEDRAEQLQARSMHLASLQLGVLVTLVETLALRDRGAARHAAAVAAYSRDLAAEIGCDEDEQDLVHTAGLLHDIGKFALPDSILHAEILSDADWSAIRRHPQDGATLVGRLDGYGPVAEIILYHHEHIDGSGYPAGLIGKEIPLLARVLAVCNAYDTMTSRYSYRTQMTPQDAFNELRRVADRKLDAEHVRSFIGMLSREDTMGLAERANVDFEAELRFEARTRVLAQGTQSR
ncbi:MAG: HD-GYP domain-containing protein [Solirubrobacteraceae bacterium]